MHDPSRDKAGAHLITLYITCSCLIPTEPHSTLPSYHRRSSTSLAIIGAGYGRVQSASYEVLLRAAECMQELVSGKIITDKEAMIEAGRRWCSGAERTSEEEDVRMSWEALRMVQIGVNKPVVNPRSPSERPFGPVDQDHSDHLGELFANVCPPHMLSKRNRCTESTFQDPTDKSGMIVGNLRRLRARSQRVYLLRFHSSLARIEADRGDYRLNSEGSVYHR